MRYAAFALLFCLAAPAAQAGEKVCRAVATSWEADGERLRTSISTEAVNGCHRLWQSVDGAETEGADCNCDLVIDGMEARFSPPPSAYQAERLVAVCRGVDVRSFQRSGAPAKGKRPTS